VYEKVRNLGYETSGTLRSCWKPLDWRKLRAVVFDACRMGKAE